MENLKFTFSDKTNTLKLTDKSSANTIAFLNELTTLTRKYSLIIKCPDNGDYGTLYLAKINDPWTVLAGQYTVNDNLKYLPYSTPHCD